MVIRFGMCGCGRFVRDAVLPNMRNVDLAAPAAALSAHRERAEKVCAEFDIPLCCATLDELLAADVDAIYISTPNVFHREQTLAAAAAGKHVFCQKPLGMDAPECRQMIDACRQEGVKLGVGFCYPFQGAQQRARELIKEGAIGDVTSFHMSMNIAEFSDPEVVGWRADPQISGGGPLMDFVPHMVDMARFFLEDEVESVMGYVRPEKTATQVETDVLAMVQFRGGARASVDASFVRGNGLNYTLVGTKGELRAAGTLGWWSGGRLILRVGEKEENVPFPAGEHVEEELRQYCQAVLNDEDPPVPGEAGLRAQEVIDAVYESGRSGRRVPVRVL